jgi:uncharacterized PurR-regulated membrane protein YhhQ (DUF165 family)
MPLKKYIATISYIAMVVTLNTLFVVLPGVSAFGQSFSPADILVGCIFLVRDFAQREIRHWIILAMVVATGISYLLADPTIALASAGGFMVGELIDWSLFTLTQKPLSQRLLISAIASSPFDSLVFLYLAHHLHWFEWGLMTAFKFLGVFILWWFWRRKQLPRYDYSRTHR